MSEKENTIMRGGFISSLSLFLTKFLGIIYVIPLNMILQTAANRDYYSVGFRVYEIILSVSIAGFPVAVAMLVSRFEAQNQHEYALMAKRYGTYVLAGFGFMMMLLMLIFAPQLAIMIKGSASTEEINVIATMIRILSIAVFIVSILGGIRGFYQGMKRIATYSFSQFIEQVVRVSIIVFGGFLFVFILKFDAVVAVYLTAIAAGLSAVIAYLILFFDFRKNYLAAFRQNTVMRHYIIKTTIQIAIPYMIMSLLAYATSIIELAMFYRVFEAVGFDKETGRIVFTAITMQGEKLSAIPLVIATGFSLASLPYLSESLAKRQYVKLRNQIRDVLSTVILVGIPLCMGIVLFTPAIFHIFFGKTAVEIGIPIVRISAFITIFTIILNICVSMLMAINARKFVIITYIIAISIKVIIYYPSIMLFGQYGPSLSTLVATIVQIGLLLVYLKKIFKINFSIVYRRTIIVLIGILIMSIFGLLVMILPIQYNGINGVIIALIVLLVFGGASIVAYLLFVDLFDLPKTLLGFDIKSILKKRG